MVVNAHSEPVVYPHPQPANDAAAGGADQVTRQELRRLEARLDGRLQEVNARVILHDGRFSAMGDRVNQTDRRSDASSARVDSRLRALDRRLDSLDARVRAMEGEIDAMDEHVSTVERRQNARWWRRRRGQHSRR